MGAEKVNKTEIIPCKERNYAYYYHHNTLTM